MTTLLAPSSTVAAPEAARTIPRRSLAALMQPLENLAATSARFRKVGAGHFIEAGTEYELPVFSFTGPSGGDDSIRIGIFATIHGDEAVGTHALVQLVQLLEKAPELARGYELFFYPVCNPTGYEDNSRFSRGGHDLNREFWKNSPRPEVQWFEQELRTRAFQGIISLHADDTSEGLYGFVRGATLTRHLLLPALDAASRLLPRNNNPVIDGFSARNGLIRQCYDGVLGAPPRSRPRPFEIIFEAPHAAPQYLQEKALVVMLTTTLTEYRKFIAYAANL